MNENSKKRILYISRAWSNDAGGMERLSFEFAEALKGRSDIELTVLAHRGSRSTSLFFVFTVIPRALMAARYADLIHLGDPLVSFTGWLIKKVTRKPVAVTVHGLDVSYPHSLYRLYLSLFFRHFDYYFPISRHAQSLLDQWHVTGKRVVVWPGVKDHSQTLSPRQGEQEIQLLTVGRLVKRKGHEWFIRHVMPQLSEQYIYLIAGDGPERDAIKNAVADTHLESRVRLLGRVDDAELVRLYSNASAFVQPNIHVEGDAEGFGLVLLDAALAGLPVFAANIDGIPDAIHDGQNGVLIESGNAQAWITALKNLKAASLPLARQYTLEQFGWKQMIERYLNAI